MRNPLPQLRGAEDPTVATLIWLMLFVGACIFALSIVNHDDKIRDAGLTALGGILFLLTAYFTARNLQINERKVFNEQLMRASELLCESERAKQAVAEATLTRMRARAHDKADQEVIDAVLNAGGSPGSAGSGIDPAGEG